MATIGNAQSFRVEGNVPGNLTVSGNATISGSSATVNGNEVRTVGTSGAIVQYKEKEYSTDFTSTSTSFVDAFTGFTFTPTSATNKVRLEFFARYYNSNVNMDTAHQFVRDSTIIWTGATYYANASAATWATSLVYTDTPGTTSQVTYKIQARIITAGAGSGDVRIITTGSNALNPNAYFRAWEIVV